MTLRDLIKWALNNNISLESQLETPNGRVTMFTRSLMEEKIILNDTSISLKIVEMMQNTGCSRQQAELYLQNNNGNVLLATTVYEREQALKNG